MEQKNQKLIELLNKKIDEIETLISSYGDGRFEQWNLEVLMILDNLIGKESDYYEKFNNINYDPRVIVTDEDNDQRFQEAYTEGLKEAKSTLKAIIFGVENNLT